MASTSHIACVVNHPRFADIQKLVTLIASIAAVAGIFFAALQVKISTDNNRRETTLNILKPTREEAVLLAFQRLGFAKDTKKPLEDTLTERATIERDLILNTYDSVAIYYKFGTIEKCYSESACARGTGSSCRNS